MKLRRYLVALALAAATNGMHAGPAAAQATRTWVSGVGDDVNPCSRTAPCKTFAGAISKTAVNGEINCLDPGGFGALTITKSITIDCQGVFASVLNSFTNGITISYDSFAGTDTLRTVRLRNLVFNGASSGVSGIRVIGSNTAGSEVFVEECLIDGNTNRGISDERSGGGEISISNTTVRNMQQTGIAIFPASGGARIDAVLDRVTVQNANFGIGVGPAARVTISRSTITGNTAGGIAAEGATASEVSVNDSVISHNGTGLRTFAGGTIRFSNSDIAYNGTAMTGINAASLITFGNSRIFGNGSAGTAPTAAGPASSDRGQQ